jgi:radical SAM protein with 4Fe4S-binding SPASM domain
VRPDLADILRAAAAREFAVRVLTNATLLGDEGGDEKADLLAEVRPTSVDVSVYGREAAHDAITRVPGSHARTMTGIKRLRGRAVPVNIKLPLMKTNRDELAWVREFAESIGAGLVFDTTVVCRPSGDRTPLAEQLSDEEVADVIRLASGGPVGRDRQMSGRRGKPIPPGGNLLPGVPVCSAGRSTARLTPSGRLTPCVAIPEAVGSLRERPFSELWRSPVLEKLRSIRLEDLPECRDCDLRAFCVRCPGQALVEEGDITAPSRAACRMARIFAMLTGTQDERERDERSGER